MVHLVDRPVSVADVRAVGYAGIVGPAVDSVGNRRAVGHAGPYRGVPVIVQDALALGLADPGSRGVGNQTAVELALQTGPVPVEVLFAMAPTVLLAVVSVYRLGVAAAVAVVVVSSVVVELTVIPSILPTMRGISLSVIVPAVVVCAGSGVGEQLALRHAAV